MSSRGTMFYVSVSICVVFLSTTSYGQDANTQCGTNEHFVECSTCEGSCQEPNPICTADCRPPSCQCLQGFVRDNNDNCVEASTCSPGGTQCGANEHFVECSSCEGSCQEPNPICTLQCRPPSCQCLSGFVRDNGTCVEASSCSSGGTECGANEHFVECSSCEGTCQEPNPICTRECKPPKCQCLQGFVRDNGNCVAASTCNSGGNSSESCGPNEEFRECGTACEPSCKDPNPQVCTLQCIVNVCQCASGFVRNAKGQCVSPKKCPKPVNPCATVLCPPRTRCILKPVVCVRAPCPPVPECVPIWHH